MRIISRVILLTLAVMLAAGAMVGALTVLRHRAAGANSALVGLLIGGGLLVLSVVVAFGAAALVVRRQAGLVCRRCGYSLTGLPRRGQCPECGTEYDLDRGESAAAEGGANE